MEIYVIKEKTAELSRKLLEVWEDSVRATHNFLSDEEIEKIKEYVPQAIDGVENLIVARVGGEIVGFCGVEKGRIEMLFVLSRMRGQGIGKRLVTFSKNNFSAKEVTVNEQNPQAVGFYEHIGFKAYRRSDLDEQGNPYPVLYMKWEMKSEG